SHSPSAGLSRMALKVIFTLLKSMAGASVSPTDSVPVCPDRLPPLSPPQAARAPARAEIANTFVERFINPPENILSDFSPALRSPVRISRRAKAVGSLILINICTCFGHNVCQVHGGGA